MKEEGLREEFKMYDLVDANGGFGMVFQSSHSGMNRWTKVPMPEPDMEHNYIASTRHEDTLQIMLTSKPKRPEPKKKQQYNQS